MYEQIVNEWNLLYDTLYLTAIQMSPIVTKVEPLSEFKYFTMMLENFRIKRGGRVSTSSINYYL